MAVTTKNPISYNDPFNKESPVPSSVDGKTGTQLTEHFFLKKALVEAAKEEYFSMLASSVALPKNYGKKIKRYSYIPLLDDRNINDQGIDATGATIEEGSGNLWGSSHDIGLITDKLPSLTEQGGRVNRVGFTRIVRESSLLDLGFFYEFTQDSIDFDSDAQLQSYIYSEAMKGASQIKEALLQRDLLNSAGVVMYPGTATSDTEVTGEGDDGVKTVVDYLTLMKLDQILTANRCPKQTKIITGSTKIDSRTIPSARIMFVGPEVSILLRQLKDTFGQPAFIPVEKYAGATTPMRGEIGSISFFRIIEVPEMLRWAGKGAAAGENNYHATGGKYDIFPMLVVGDDSFNTISFAASSDAKNFKIIKKMPGADTADYSDPYGKKGFVSLQWYYGFLCNRPERIAVVKTVAPM